MSLAFNAASRRSHTLDDRYARALKPACQPRCRHSDCLRLFKSIWRRCKTPVDDVTCDHVTGTCRVQWSVIDRSLLSGQRRSSLTVPVPARPYSTNLGVLVRQSCFTARQCVTVPYSPTTRLLFRRIPSPLTHRGIDLRITDAQLHHRRRR